MTFWEKVYDKHVVVVLYKVWKWLNAHGSPYHSMYLLQPILIIFYKYLIWTLMILFRATCCSNLAPQNLKWQIVQKKILPMFFSFYCDGKRLEKNVVVLLTLTYWQTHLHLSLWLTQAALCRACLLNIHEAMLLSCIIDAVIMLVQSLWVQQGNCSALCSIPVFYEKLGESRQPKWQYAIFRCPVIEFSWRRL